MIEATLCALLWLTPPTRPQDDEFVPGTHVPPQVGEVAKPIETVYWYYEGPERHVPKLAELRGEVVLVHTWGYYCGPCIKEGVPYVVDLLEANEGLGLRALSISVQIGDGQPDDHFVKVGREMGMNHPMGLADGYGGMCPYLNMNVNKGLTWCFVIGREGGVRWAGDPSIDDEEFLEAVRVALAEEAAPPLPEGTPEPLAKAVALYVGGDLGRARVEAEKVAGKLARKKESQEIATALERASALVRAIDDHRADLDGRLTRALEVGDAESYVTARRLLLARFEKAGAQKQMKELDRRVETDGELAAAVEAWSAWDELRRARPALFPAREDKACKRYAKELRRYVDGAPEDRPGLARARELLAAFETE